MDYKKHIAGVLCGLTELTEGELLPLLERPKDETMGDLAFPCFTLARVMKKAPPAIAAQLAEKLSADDYIQKVQAVGGYLNFFYKRDVYTNGVVEAVCQKGADYGRTDAGAGKTVIVEFSSPNIAKPFHIGHLFSTAVGHALANIYDALGYKVERINHLGDWGTQFGKLICAYKRWGDEATVLADPINELMKIYVRFHEEAEKEPGLEDEARAEFKRLEDKEPENTRLWQWFRDISLEEFKKTYKFLDINFDSFNGEAFYSDKMDAVIDTMREKNLLTESDGAQIVSLEDEGLVPCIVLKSDGSTIYATRDIAAAIYRKNTYDFYRNIYVVGQPQALHFKQVFAVLKKMGYNWSDDCNFVGFGTVKFPDRKMATRSGDVVLLADVLDESIKKCRSVMEENESEIKNLDETSKRVGIGAILYTFLKNGREKDIIFDWNDILDFEGESGPYVQYSFARGMSVLRRAEGIDYASAEFSGEVTDDEYALAKLLADFTRVTEDAAAQNEPFYVTRYATAVARAFNKFYNTSPILRADDEDTKRARLRLTAAACVCIQNALALLGIKTVDQM